MSLTFQELKEANFVRSEESYQSIDVWTDSDWVVAVSSEWGEVCHLLTKSMRGESVSDKSIGDELADTVICLDLLAQRLGIDLGQSVVRKFNQTSSDVGSFVKLRGEPEADA